MQSHGSLPNFFGNKVKSTEISIFFVTFAADMKQQPLVSFILTDYNLPTELLCEAIDSILRLSLRSTEREIIIVDDGSDSSPKEAGSE